MHPPDYLIFLIRGSALELLAMWTPRIFWVERTLDELPRYEEGS